MLKKRILAIFTSAALIAGAMPAAFASADAASSSREFTQDFESEGYKASPVFGNFKDKKGNTYKYINNGATARKALAADTVYVVEGALYQNQYAEDGTLQAPANDMPKNDWLSVENFSKQGYLTDNLRSGGFDGYTGLTTAFHIVPQVLNKVTWVNPDGTENMMLKTFDGSTALSFLTSSHKDFQTHASSDTSYSAIGFDWFGKEGMELYGYKSKISFDIRNHKTAWQVKDDSSTGFVTLSITKNLGKLKDKCYTLTHSPQDQTRRARASINSTDVFKKDADNGGVTDAVTIYKGAAYLGDTVSPENKICDMMTYDNAGRDTSWYTVEVYIDYETNPTSPDLAVIIKNRADGSVVGANSGKLPISSDGTTATSAYGRKKGDGIVKALVPYDTESTTGLFGKNKCASFTAEQADTDNYGVFVTGAANGDWAKAFYLDNFTFAGYDEIPQGFSTATLNTETKTVNVSITSFSKLAGKLIAAEYDKTTGALLQSQVVDADTSTASNYAITFTKDLSANGEYSVFLWENFENIKPLLDTVTVE